MPRERQQDAWSQNSSVKKATWLSWRIYWPGMALVGSFLGLAKISSIVIFSVIFTYLALLIFAAAQVVNFVALGLFLKGRRQIAKEQMGDVP